MDVTILAGDCLELLATLPAESVDSIVTDPPAGIAFMAKSWDGDKGGRDAWVAWLTSVMVEAHRVLKPGGHALVWALPRTSHWTATALEDAGFEIRDCVVHLFGTGFPKGLDVGKAIDRAAGAEREVLGPGQHHSPGRRVEWGNGVTYGTQTARGKWETAPATPGGAEWDGWNTSLRPGHEHWWLVRKPLRGTVASNVVEYGTGAINVAGCRVPTSEGDDQARQRGSSLGFTGGTPGVLTGGGSAGRWPTNLVFTHSAACEEAGPCAEDCPVGELDAQSGVRRSGGDITGSDPTAPFPHTHGVKKQRRPWVRHGDIGGASRFFPTFRYQAKAPRSERPTVDGVNHPTVKSLDLMRWLVRLVTPPGGTVLDMFAGSGTTLEAARLEEFSAIGMEAEADYVPLIRARLARVPMPREGA